MYGLCCDCAFLPWKHMCPLLMSSQDGQRVDRWLSCGALWKDILLLCFCLSKLVLKLLAVGWLGLVPPKHLLWPSPPCDSGKKRGHCEEAFEFESWRPSHIKDWDRAYGYRCFHTWLILFPHLYYDNMVCGPHQQPTVSKLQTRVDFFFWWHTYPQYRTDLRQCPRSSCVVCRKRNCSPKWMGLFLEEKPLRNHLESWSSSLLWTHLGSCPGCGELRRNIYPWVASFPHQILRQD